MVAKDDPSTREVIRRQAHTDSIAWYDANPMAASVATALRQNFGSVVQDNSKAPLIVGAHMPVAFQAAFFCHAFPLSNDEYDLTRVVTAVEAIAAFSRDIGR